MYYYKLEEPGAPEVNTIKPPVYKSRLTIVDLQIDCIGEMPNWWWRMWQYLLLGFRWEKLEGGEE